MLICSCSTQKLTKQLQGSWNIEELKLNDKSILWDQQWVTIMLVNKDGTCKLPARDLSIDRMAKWEVRKKDTTHFLVISEAKDTLFNDEYTIEITEKPQLNIKVKILELRSKDLYLKCTQ